MALLVPVAGLFEGGCDASDAGTLQHPYGAWSSLAHGLAMTIMSAEAVAHGLHRKDSPQDIVIMGVIGVTLLALLPAEHESPVGAPISEPRFVERRLHVGAARG